MAKLLREIVSIEETPSRVSSKQVYSDKNNIEEGILRSIGRYLAAPQNKANDYKRLSGLADKVVTQRDAEHKKENYGPKAKERNKRLTSLENRMSAMAGGNSVWTKMAKTPKDLKYMTKKISPEVSNDGIVRFHPTDDEYYKLYNKHHLYYSVSPDHKKIAANNNKNFKTIPYSNQRWHDLVKFRTEKGLWTNLNQYHKDVKEKRRKERIK